METNNYQYIKRLIEWNNSKKYISECNFLGLLLQPKEDDMILDYGCGTGFCLEYLKKKTKAKFYGFDVNIFFEKNKIPDWFLFKLNKNLKFNKIYFMHSFAHIKDPNQMLLDLRNILKEDGRVYVITPNRDFDDYFKRLDDKSYSPDITVIKHYTIKEISALFSELGFQIEVIGQFGKKVSSFHERIFLIASLIP